MARMSPDVELLAWLVRANGPLAGRRHLLKSEVTRIGRDPRNELVLAGEAAAVVSGRHVEVRREVDGFHAYDLGSTNGLFINGEKLDSHVLSPGDVLELGPGGPRFAFETERLPASQVDSTQLALPEAKTLLTRAAPGATAPPADPPSSTAMLIHQAVETVLAGRKRKWRLAAASVGIISVVLAGVVAWSTWEMRGQKSDIEAKIAELESRLASEGLSVEETEQLAARLEAYQREADVLRENPLFRLAGFDDEVIFVEAELRTLLEAFGAEQYYLPPDFVSRVEHYVSRLSGEDRQRMKRALGESRDSFEQMRARFAAYRLPPDLAFVAVAESALRNDTESSQGAVGVWQFRAPTARQYGLRVDSSTDERLDPVKSTEAAASYFRDLILDFGAGSSVMLAIAAYNVGPTKMRSTIRGIEDPIQQRNFWYLYRTRKLPAQTREYVPRVLAAMIIGRNAERYEFE